MGFPDGISVGIDSGTQNKTITISAITMSILVIYMYYNFLDSYIHFDGNNDSISPK